MFKEINIFNIKFYPKLGNNFFLLGTFFLPSALPISAIFYIFSLIISYFNFKVLILKDKWNIPLFISIGIMIFSTFHIAILNKPLILSNYKNSIIWLNLVNWIPIFFYYWGFQFYLKNHEERITFVKVLVSGTIPLIVSMILQKFFHFYGPFETLFGLIVWFQKPLKYDAVTGLFSNPNYTAIWLAMVLPFVFFLFTNIKKINFKKYFLFILLVLFLYLLLLTQSRNGFLGILLTIIFLYRFKKLPIIFNCSFFIFSFGTLSIIASKYNSLFSFYFPKNLLNRLFEFDFSKAYRPTIWESAILRIQERPFFGWGGSTFSYLHQEYRNLLEMKGNFIPAYHSHNIILELAHSFGLPLAILLSSVLTLFFFRSGFLIYFMDIASNESIFNKTWFVSILIFLIMHLTDITFYDGKISILACLLFAGLRNIIKEINIKNLEFISKKN